MRFDVTPILAEGIRMTRIQNGIASKDVAAALYRSPAYISKLERGDIKTIEDEELTTILNFIVHVEGPGEPTLSKRLETLVSNLAPRYSPEEIEKELWLENYDWVICKIPVPPTLPTAIASEMEQAGISPEQLGDAINSNAELPEALRNDDAIPYNQWKDYYEAKKFQNHYIKLRIPQTDIGRFLNGRISSSNYLLAFTIARFSHWLSKYPEEEVISDSRGQELSKYTVRFLNSFRFSSESDLRRQRRNEEQEEFMEKLYSGELVSVSGVLGDFLPFLDKDFQENPERFLSTLKQLSSNMNWDPAFMMKIMSLTFTDLGGLSYYHKRQLLYKIEDLIQSYKDMPEGQRRWESYD